MNDPILENFRDEVNEFLLRWEMRKTTFSRKVMNNPEFVDRIMADDAVVTTVTMVKVRAFMHGYTSCYMDGNR